MKDELLHYYQQELEHLQAAGSAFAKRYPKIAKNLAMENGGNNDPAIARLIESVAFMNARVHHKLDDDFTEFTSGLFNILQPAYRHPLPSMMVAQFQPSADLEKAFVIPRHTAIERIASPHEPLRFSTCYPTTLLPVTVQAAQLLPHCESAPELKSHSASACLHIVLRCLDPEQNFAHFSPESLRFFLRGNQAWAIYDLLLRHTCAISLSHGGSTKEAVWFNPDQLKPVGFASDEMILPYEARQPLAYQLLTEYFAYPQKFSFLELATTSTLCWENIGNEAHLFFYLKQAPLLLQTAIKADSFALGCTPLINLYPKLAEPVMVTGQQTEYSIIPDIRQTEHHAIYHIDQVSAIDDEGSEKNYLPLYALDHTAEGYWFAQRKAKISRRSLDTLLSLRLTALNGRPLTQTGQVLRIETHCFNPILPQLWQQLAQPSLLQLAEASAPVSQIIAITEPSSVQYPLLAEGNSWRLISSLSQQHLSLMQGKHGAAALKEILQLYDVQANEQSQAIIQSIQNLSIKPAARRLPQAGIISFCQGLAITINLEEEPFTGNSMLLLIKVLEQFLTLQASLNSFTQLDVLNKNQQLIYQGKAMIGSQKLL